MSKTVSVRIAHKNSGQAATQRRHNERLGSQPKYIDSDKTGLNSVLIKAPGEAQLRERCEAYKSQRTDTKRTTKVNAAVLTDCIITFGTEAQVTINALSKEAQNELFMQTAKAISKQLNSDLVSLVVHRDETAIHAHFGLLAVNKDGYAISKATKPKDLAQLQDVAGEVYKHLDITRGEHKATRIARGDDASKIYNRSVKQLHEDLPLEIEKKQLEIDKLSLEIAKKDELLVHTAKLLENAKEQLLSTGLNLKNLQKAVEDAEKQKLEAEEKRIKNERLASQAQQKINDTIKQGIDFEDKIKKLQKNLVTYEKRADDAKNLSDELDANIAQKTQQIEHLQQTKKLVEQAVNAVYDDQTARIKEPKVQAVKVVENEGGLLKKATTKTVEMIDKKDFEEYKLSVESKDIIVKNRLFNELNQKAGDLEAFESHLKTKDNMLKNREQKIEKRENELGINKAQGLKLGL